MKDTVYIQAKLGDSHSQKLLFDHFVNISKPITYKHSKSNKNTGGIPPIDLETLIIEAYETILFSSEIHYKADEFFKYLYIQRIKDYFRKKLRKEELLKKYAEDNYFEKTEVINNTTIYEQNYSNGHELIDVILDDKKAGLTELEKRILSMFLKSFTVEEISSILSICYSQVFRKLRNAQKKCKNYIEKYLPDLPPNK